MTVPAGSVISFLPNQLDDLCGALVSELSSDGNGLVEQPIDMQPKMSNDTTIAKRRCTNTSCLGSLIVPWPIAHLEDAEGVMVMVVGGNQERKMGNPITGSRIALVVPGF